MPLPYTLYGSNSSHSGSNEHGTGGRTYHIPNYATSYANNRTNLITLTFNETSQSRNWVQVAVILILAVLLFTAVAKVEALPSRRNYSEQWSATTKGLPSKYGDLYKSWLSDCQGCGPREDTAPVWNLPALDLFHCCDYTPVRTTHGREAPCETQKRVSHQRSAATGIDCWPHVDDKVSAEISLDHHCRTSPRANGAGKSIITKILQPCEGQFRNMYS